MPTVIADLRAKGQLVESDGAQVVPLEDHNLPACLIIKEDGATIYATADLAAAEYRRDHYAAENLLYVVDQGQSVHFKQVFAVLRKAGHAWSENCHHVGSAVFQYLLDLAQVCYRFYHDKPILKADPDVRTARSRHSLSGPFPYPRQRSPYAYHHVTTNCVGDRNGNAIVTGIGG